MRESGSTASRLPPAGEGARRADKGERELRRLTGPLTPALSPTGRGQPLGGPAPQDRSATAREVKSATSESASEGPRNACGIVPPSRKRQLIIILRFDDPSLALPAWRSEGVAKPPARLAGEEIPFAWRLWDIDSPLSNTPGVAMLTARAADNRGRTRPMKRGPMRGHAAISHALPIDVEVRWREAPGGQ
jgi:hypothetical protein